MSGLKVFPSDETTYYLFGVKMGLLNLFHNGTKLGLKKTLGKILQPINSYKRFSEYLFMGRKIETFLKNAVPGETVKILDVGSPKCFGLYLAFRYNVDICLTDIDNDSVREAEVLWDAIKPHAKGNATFAIQDARALEFADEEFSIVFSMSVIEHIEGQSADSHAMRELERVLNSRGLLLLTVPIGNQYVEQQRVGLRAAVQRTGDQSLFFFQRIYTPQTATDRIIKAIPEVTLVDMATACQKAGFIADIYRRSGGNIRGMLGFLLPLLSANLNYISAGAVEAPSSYRSVYSENDLYGDLMLAWEKPASEKK